MTSVRGRVLSSAAAARAVPWRLGAAEAPLGAVSGAKSEVERLRSELEGARSGVKQREELLELARALAERLLGEVLRLEPERVAELASEVLRDAAGARRITLFASRGDWEVLMAAQPLLAEAYGLRLEVASDDSLGPGDLYLDSELGKTDARVRTRLEHLLEILRQGPTT